jgi:hypothetical protein
MWSMQRIYYAGDRFLTGTEIANALVSYAAALAQQGTAGAIEIPVRHEHDGRTSVVHFLLGPASQIVTEEVEADDYDEVHNDALVQQLRVLTSELAPMHPVTDQSQPDRVESVDYDWTDEV